MIHHSLTHKTVSSTARLCSVYLFPLKLFPIFIFFASHLSRFVHEKHENKNGNSIRHKEYAHLNETRQKLHSKSICRIGWQVM